MKFLINASNIRGGGGQQVADSICGMLYKYEQHYFIVVLNPNFKHTEDRIRHFENVKVFYYDIRKSIALLLSGRDKYLDEIVEKYNINAVLTVFGPSFGWCPKVPHLCGYARPQLVLKDSPHYASYGIIEKLRLYFLKFLFKRASSIYYTENPYISNLVKDMFDNAEVYTITNYYNQIFDQPEKWVEKQLPSFDGVTLLTVSTSNPHKNYPIIPLIALCLKKKYPNFNFRFVLTISENDLDNIPDEIKANIIFLGWTDIAECPSLYKQASIMFMPSLMECFTATYPEAMRMGVPIVTTDLEFASGLCEEAACYYNAVDAENAAEAIYKVATNHQYATKLVANGKKQLNKYDNYEQRADKLIAILEKISQ